MNRVAELNLTADDLASLASSMQRQLGLSQVNWFWLNNWLLAKPLPPPLLYLLFFPATFFSDTLNRNLGGIAGQYFITAQSQYRNP